MDFVTVWTHLPDLLSGVVITLKLTFSSLVIGFLLAIPLALMRLSSTPLLFIPASTFMFYFRGTPLLVQLFLIYYGSGQFRHELTDLGLWQFFRDAWFCAVLALTLNTSAYTAEIFRGAIAAVSKHDLEAGRALGMSKLLLFRRITFPAAFRIALPAYGNEVILLLQSTSLVSVITLMDLTGVANRLVTKTFTIYEIYLTVALIYIVMTYITVTLLKYTHNMINSRH